MMMKPEEFLLIIIIIVMSGVSIGTGYLLGYSSAERNFENSCANYGKYIENGHTLTCGVIEE